MDKQRVLAIINPKAGTKSKSGIPDAIKRILNNNLFSVEMRTISGEGDAERFAAQAAADGFNIVIAIGGDGTVNGAATALTHTSTALAIVPCGSGNGLARHLHIPLNVDKALNLINDNYFEQFDYCTVNDRPFFCTCGMGFDAWVAHKFASAGTRGLVTYVKKTIGEYISYKPREYKIEIDNQVITERAFVIACANAAQYGNNAFIAPHASMQDGKIDVTLIQPFNPLMSPVLGARLFLKNIDKNHSVKVYRTSQLTITRPYAEVIHIDGEPIEMPATLHIAIHPAGLKVIIPKQLT